ncbi:facilitated trehalose transporter Tret1-like [Rhodnius prolixus]|uniref:facilitated trehalose transporter Tret1-like n=1 Tax=Rhodnius prolixus TaxID=13249 RepID=UPI003D18CAAD
MELSSSKQVGMCLIASCNLLTNGMTIAYPAVALPAMMQANSGLELTLEQMSWIASLSPLTMIAGSLIIGPLLDKWGRRLGFVLTGIPAVLGWIIIGIMPRSVACLYIGRLLVGLASGFGGASASVFMAEVTSPKIRGALTVTKNLTFSIGLTIMYIIGMVFQDDWSKMAFCGAAVPTLCLLFAIFCLPESEIWLKSNSPNKPNSPKHSFRELLKTYRTRPEVYKPMYIMNALLILRQLSGTSVLMSYAVSLVKMTGVRGDPHLVTVILGVTRIVAGLTGCALSGYLGRRVPVSWSGAIMSITMLWLARNIRKDNEEPAYWDTLVLIAFMFTSTIFTSICQALIGEVFPTDVRGLCTGITTCLSYLSSFTALKLYPLLLEFLGKTNLFLLYGTFCVLGALLAILTLPETKDKTLTEIQGLFSKKKPVVAEVKETDSNPAEVELLGVTTNSYR